MRLTAAKRNNGSGQFARRRRARGLKKGRRERKSVRRVVINLSILQMCAKCNFPRLIREERVMSL